jgi:hypothetical protein
MSGNSRVRAMEIFDGIVEEELNRLKSLKKQYEHELSGYMKGCLIKKNIKGHIYYYLNYRDNKKKVFKYLGKLSEDKVSDIKKKIEKRRNIKKLYIQVKKNIRRLEKISNGKER